MVLTKRIAVFGDEIVLGNIDGTSCVTTTTRLPASLSSSHDLVSLMEMIQTLQFESRATYLVA